MIISHKNKFAFFRNPKTGSTTAEIMLRLCGVFDPMEAIMSSSIFFELEYTNLPDNIEHPPVPDAFFARQRVSRRCIHWGPNEAIEGGLITLDQLREYKTYAFIREPKSRCISAFAHMAGTRIIPEMMKENVRNNYFWGLAGKPQVDFLLVDGELVVKPLFFDDFDNELRRMIADIGGHYFPEIPYINKNPYRDPSLTMQPYMDVHTHKIIERRYADDFKLYHSLMEARRNDEPDGTSSVCAEQG